VVALNGPTGSPSVRKDAAWSTAGLIIVSGLLFTYVTLRASLIPITWDEAYNYLEFTRKGALFPTHFRAMTANHHHLNTWLTYLTTVVGGVSEITLRLPALAAHLLFLYFTARFCLELSSGLLRVAAFIVLNANPYVLDFFGLARGYGLAYGLLAGSLWYLYRFFRTDLRARYGTASLALASLAVTAHLTLIHFLLSLTVVVLLATTLTAPAGAGTSHRVAHALKVNVAGLTIVGLVLLPAAFVIRGLRAAGAFFYGGSTSFWRDTVLGIFSGLLYDKPYALPLGTSPGAGSFPLSHLLGILAMLLMAAALGTSIRSVTRYRSPQHLFLPALVALVSACALASIIQHHLLGVPYLQRRTGMYLLLVVAFVLVMVADGTRRTPWRHALPVLALLMSLHLVNCLNLTYAVEWKPAADVPDMLGDIAATTRATHGGGGRPIVLGVNLEFEAPVNFYRLVDRLTWLNVADRKMKSHPLSDFYLYSEADMRGIAADSLVVLHTYPLSRSRLLRRRIEPAGHAIGFARTLDFDAPADSLTTVRATSGETAYSGTRSGVTDEHHRRSGAITHTPAVGPGTADRSLINVKAMVWMRSVRNATAQLVVVFERNDRPYSWQTMSVQDGVHRPRTWLPVQFTAFVPPHVRQGDRVSVYLENRQGRVHVDDLAMRWVTATWPPPAARPPTAGH
jgi:hypothetical protein